MIKKVYVEGPFLTQSGYGEHARYVLRALRTRSDVDLYAHPLNWGATSWQAENTEERNWLDSVIRKTIETQTRNQDMSFDYHVFVGLPHEFVRKAPQAVCVTAGIETTKVSQEWIKKTYEINKIIVPSEHAANGFRNTEYIVANEERPNQPYILSCNTQIDVIPYPVKQVDPCESFDLDLEFDFNFLAVCTLIPRKNLHSLLLWFLEEFKDDEVGLVLKVGRGRNSNMDFEATRSFLDRVLRERSKTKCKVYLLHGDLTEEEMTSLYTRSDIKCLLTTSHGEGYGLPLFEASYLGLPIVSPDWGGQLDFLYGDIVSKGKTKKKALFGKVDYDIRHVAEDAVWEPLIVKDSMWCFPREQSFKNRIRDVYKNYGMYKSWAKKLKEQNILKFSEQDLLEKLSLALVGQKVNTSLNVQTFD